MSVKFLWALLICLCLSSEDLFIFPEELPIFIAIFMLSVPWYFLFAHSLSLSLLSLSLHKYIKYIPMISLHISPPFFFLSLKSNIPDSASLYQSYKDSKLSENENITRGIIFYQDSSMIYRQVFKSIDSTREHRPYRPFRKSI